MTDLFRPDNTSGYTEAERFTLNAEFRERSRSLLPGSDEWNAAANAFCDEVSRRIEDKPETATMGNATKAAN